ncbi:MAG: hypothetical protein ACJAQT_000310 [Akkermansiaceae bacterium]
MRKSHPSKFSRSSYTLDQNLSEDLRFKRENGLFESPPISKKPFIILLLLIAGLITAGLHPVLITAFALLALFILAINQSHREGDAITADCPSCSQEMIKKEQGSVELFICHHCKIYATGRDSS